MGLSEAEYQKRIAELEQANADLQSLNSQLADALDDVTDGFLLCDADDRIVHSNVKYREIFASVEDLVVPGVQFEALGRELLNRTEVAEAKGREEEWIADRLAAHRNPQSPREIVSEDGRVIRYTEFKTAAGGIVGVLTDVTEIKDREETIRDSATLLREVIDSLPMAFVMWDADENVVMANRVQYDWYPELREAMSPGAKLEDHLRTVASLGMAENIFDGDVEKYVAWRLDMYRNPPADGIESRKIGNRWLKAYNHRLSDGSYVGIRMDVSDLKQREFELETSEARFQDFAETGSDWLWETDENLRFNYFSDRLSTITGMPLSHFLGRSRIDVGTGDDSDPAWLRHLDDLAAQRPFQDFRYSQILSNGKTFHVSVSGKPVYDENGAFRGYRGTGTDLTETVRAEEALRKNEKLFQEFLENTPPVITIKDMDGRFLLVSKSFAERRGIPADQILGKTVYDLDSFSDPLSISIHDQEVIDLKRSVVRDERRVRSDGGTSYISVHKFPILDDEENVIAVGTIISDNTQLKKHEIELSEKNALLKTVFDTVPAMLSIRDREERFTLVNRANSEFFGVSADDMIGKTVEEILGKEATPIVEFHEKIYEAGTIISDPNFASTLHPGRTLWVLGAPIFAEDGELLGTVKVTFDVTDQRNAEMQLRQSQKMESMGQLTGGLAHDFNNLLGVILGNLDLLSDSVAPGSPQHRLLEAAMKAADSGAAMTRQLLAFSRKQPLEPRNINLNDRISGMLAMLERVLEATVEVDMVLSEDLWSCVADPAQVESALLNLAVNARHAMPSGGRLTIETSNVRLDDDYAAAQAELSAGNYVMLAVTDTGTGMPDAVVEKAFEPFFTTKEVGQGSGLGLSMVFGFAKQSGGHVTICSEVGIGTTVKLYLPRSGVAALGETPKREETVSTHGEQVLVVEDDPDLRMLVVALLGDLGYTVRAAAEGAGAIEMLSREDPVDLLLTDVVLPGGMGGADVAREAQRLRPGIKVLYMSGYAEDAISHHGRLEDGVILLQKPFRKAELAEKVRTALFR